MDTTKAHIRDTLKLAIPVSIGYMGHVTLGLTDSLMVGKLGAVHLAAASLIVHIFGLTLVIALGLGFAITPIVANADGEGNPELCREALRHGLLINGITGFLFFGIQMIFAELLPFLRQDPEVTRIGAQYLRILALTFLPVMVTISFKNFIEGLSFTKPAMYIVLSANIMNILGNWLLIYGNLGFPAMGLNGAGISTLINELYMAAAIAVYTYRSKRFKKYMPLIHRGKLRRQLIFRLLKVGLPTGVHYFFEVGSISVFAIMMGWLGAQYLAAHQIALTIASVSFMVVFGVASAATIRIGNALGRDNPREAKQAGFAAIGLGACIMIGFGLIFIAFRGVIPRLFIDDPVVISTASVLIVIAALFQIADGSQAVGMGSLRGLEDTRVPMTIAFIVYWLVGIPVAYCCGFLLHWGAAGIWTGLLTGLFIAAGLFILRFRRKINDAIALSERVPL